MCGIAGVVGSESSTTAEASLRSMLASLRHRGPDEFGYYLDDEAGIGNARLSIIDLAGGSQPIANEDESLWIVFNGEIFNYLELRADLESLGHCFSTHSDTEVVLHMYEEFGPECLDRLNGQFAIAIWNRHERELFLGRDRLGVRPLFYAQSGRTFYFGSEVKAVMNGLRSPRELDRSSLLDAFTYWSPQPGKTAFRGVSELLPGHFLRLRSGVPSTSRYWQLDFSTSLDTAHRPVPELLEQFSELLVDAVRIRLRADVPVGAYLSGGLDSSAITAIIRKHTSNRLDTFSIAFTDEEFDESAHQRRMAAFLGTTHHVVEATHSDIARVFPEVVWHAEVPLLRTAPAPMFLLSSLVRDVGFKVVLTGEGADEFLAGYDIFKETKIRQFWARRADSRMRPALLRRLYPEIVKAPTFNEAFFRAFFAEGLGDVDEPDYSHALRWRNNRRTWRFFTHDVLDAATAAPRDQLHDLLPAGFRHWAPLERAQFLEVATFLSPYLLSSQGDRMAMAHSVEARYPFLDYRVVAFCSQLPSRLKMRGLREKRLLRSLVEPLLPREIAQRRKRPYRAPIHKSFFGPHSPDYVQDLLSPDSLERAGLFDAGAVSRLVAKLTGGKSLGETDDMALAGILSTQLLQRQFVEQFRPASPLADSQLSRVCRRIRSQPTPQTRP